MEVHQVIHTLEALAAGVHPMTGAALADDLAQSPDVVRALFTAANLLKLPAPPVAAPSAPRPAAAGARWTDDEDARLTRAFDDGTPIAEIASIHGRTKGAITSRLVKLGRIDPDTVRVRDRNKLSVA